MSSADVGPCSILQTATNRSNFSHRPSPSNRGRNLQRGTSYNCACYLLVSHEVTWFICIEMTKSSFQTMSLAFSASPQSRDGDPFLSDSGAISYGNKNMNRVPFPTDIEAVLQRNKLKYVKKRIDPQFRFNHQNMVNNVIKRFMNEQYNINDMDGKSHFVHRRRLTVIIDRRGCANTYTLWFVYFVVQM